MLRFASRVLNCYRGFSYAGIAVDEPCDIEITPHTTLIVQQGNENIRVLQSVKDFRPLGALVGVRASPQMSIERLAVRALDLSIASMHQLMVIVLLVSLVSVLVLIKLYDTKRAD